MKKRFVTQIELQELLKDPCYVEAQDERRDFQGYYATKGKWVGTTLFLKESNTQEVFLIEENVTP